MTPNELLSELQAIANVSVPDLARADDGHGRVISRLFKEPVLSSGSKIERGPSSAPWAICSAPFAFSTGEEHAAELRIVFSHRLAMATERMVQGIADHIFSVLPEGLPKSAQLNVMAPYPSLIAHNSRNQPDVVVVYMDLIFNLTWFHFEPGMSDELRFLDPKQKPFVGIYSQDPPTNFHPTEKS